MRVCVCMHLSLSHSPTLSLSLSHTHTEEVSYAAINPSIKSFVDPHQAAPSLTYYEKDLTFKRPSFSDLNFKVCVCVCVCV